MKKILNTFTFEWYNLCSFFSKVICIYAYAYYTSAVYIQANILIEVLHGVAKNGIYVNSSLVHGFICILLSMWLS